MTEQITSPRQRYFDDFSVGDSFVLGSAEVTETELLEFATRFDPQPFHIDRAAAEASIYGGLIASGWHTGSISMRLLAQGFLGPSSMGSPGFDQLRWLAPVRAGDVVTLHVVVLEMTPSRSKPDRGIVRVDATLVNQSATPVLTYQALLMLARGKP